MSTFAYVPLSNVEPRPSEEGAAEIRHLTLLAPAPDVFPSSFRKVVVDPSHHGLLMKQMQRLRGSVYLEDGAIQPEALDDTGCHTSPNDAQSFHVLALNRHQQVVGCSRFRAYQPDVRFEELSLAQAPLAQDPILGAGLRAAVRQQIAWARERNYLYVEIGGWALHASIRYSTEALRIAALNFSLGVALGGAAAICTATLRNNSAMILRRLGGLPLSSHGSAIPPYYDERYRCEIEVLTFDSDLIPPRHASRVEELRGALNATTVVCFEAPGRSSLMNLLDATASAAELPAQLAAA